MPTELAQHIQRTSLCDTHEHLRKEAEYVERGPERWQVKIGKIGDASIREVDGRCCG